MLLAARLWAKPIMTITRLEWASASGTPESATVNEREMTSLLSVAFPGAQALAVCLFRSVVSLRMAGHPVRRDGARRVHATPGLRSQSDGSQ
jgi:hypothetical protein